MQTWKKIALFRGVLMTWTVWGVCHCRCLRPNDPDRPRDFVDLSHWLDNDSPVPPKYQPYNMTVLDHLVGESVGESEVLVMSSHSGTHLNAPSHAVKEKLTLDEIPPEELYGPAVVISVKTQVKLDRNYVIKPADINYFEYRNGKIPDGRIVLFNTGWSQKWNSAKDYLGTSSREKRKLSGPGLSKEAAELLVHEREVLGIGTDSFSYDLGNSTDHEVHLVLAKANRWGLVNLNNLDLLSPFGCQVYVLPMKLFGASGAPARVIAFCEQTCAKNEREDF